MQYVLTAKMPHDDISGYALKHIALDRDEDDRSTVRNLRWGAFLEMEHYYSWDIIR